MLNRDAVALMLAMLVGCGPAVLPSAPDPDLISDDDRRCATASDCIIVQASCCPCNSTGSNAGKTAVAASAVDVIDQRRESCPAFCSAAVSNSDTCCAEDVSCVDQRCELTGTPGLQVGVDCKFDFE